MVSDDGLSLGIGHLLQQIVHKGWQMDIGSFGGLIDHVLKSRKGCGGHLIGPAINQQLIFMHQVVSVLPFRLLRYDRKIHGRNG